MCVYVYIYIAVHKLLALGSNGTAKYRAETLLTQESTDTLIRYLSIVDLAMVYRLTNGAMRRGRTRRESSKKSRPESRVTQREKCSNNAAAVTERA